MAQLVCGAIRPDFELPARPLPPDFLYAVGRAYSLALKDAPGLHQDAGSGAFYTPGWVARRLCALALATAGAPAAVLDPACGAGALLLAALERHQRVPRLIGWDIDASALSLGRAILETYANERGLSPEIQLSQRDLFLPSTDGSADGADLIVMNPPFGTRLERSAADFAGGADMSGREPDLFALCLERALRLRGVGTVAAILPDVIRMQPEYSGLRRAISDRYVLEHLEQLPFGSFPEATVQPLLAVIALRNSNPDSPDLPVHVDSEGRWRLDGGALEDIWHRCVAAGTPLGQIACCHEGVHTGNVRHKLFTGDPNAPHARPMLKGADVAPFGFVFRRRYLRYDPQLIDRRAGEYASLRDPVIFRGPKILSRQTSDRLIACLDPGHLVCDNTLHSIKLRDSVQQGSLALDGAPSLEWLLLFLNSSLATALYRYQSGERDRPLPQVKLRLLRRLPVPGCPLSSDELRSVLSRAEAEAANAGLSSGTVEAIDEVVFESFCLANADRRRIRAAV